MFIDFNRNQTDHNTYDLNTNEHNVDVGLPVLS